MGNNETVFERDKAKYLSTLVHDEWLETIIAGHEEKYQDWANFAAWLIVKCLVPEQPHGTNS